MATYGPGAISPGSYGPNDTFVSGTVVPDGSFLCNPTYAQDGVVFGRVTMVRCDPRLPPHQTGTGVVFGCGSTVEYVAIGNANVICDPSSFAPVSVGADTVVGSSNATEVGEGVSITDTVCQGQEVAGGAEPYAGPYDYCAKVCGDGVVAGDASVVDSSRCIGGEE